MALFGKLNQRKRVFCRVLLAEGDVDVPCDLFLLENIKQSVFLLVGQRHRLCITACPAPLGLQRRRSHGTRHQHRRSDL